MPTPLRLGRALALLAILAIGILLTPAPGAAQNPIDAFFEARSFSPIRAGDIRVDYRENTELNSRLAAEIAKA